MKNLCIVILVAFSIKSYSQEELIPISPNGVWINGSGNWDIFGNFFYNTPTGLAISDTLNFNDTLYLQFSSFAYCTEGQTFSDEFLLREDSGKYYFKQSIEDAEILWFDFTLDVGESITLENCYGQVGVEGMEQLTVLSIEPVILGDGSERRKWTLQYSNNQSGYYLMTEEWIEGIGNMQQGLRHPTAQTCIDIGHWLRCYYEDDEWVETFTPLAPGTDCCTLVGVGEIDPNNLFIYPNPTTNELTIKNTVSISTVEISDLTGNIVLTLHPNTTQTELNLESFSSGCYFVTATTKGGSIVTRKFIKD